MSEQKRPQKKVRDEEAYTLHIGAVPHTEPAVVEAHVVVRSPFEYKEDSLTHQVEALKREKAASRKSGTTLWSFIWDKLQFVLVSLVVFVVIYVVLNWSALWMIASHQWDVWRGFVSPLEQIVNDVPDLPEKLLRTASSVNSGEVIPPLNLEVYPPDMRILIPRINQNVPVVGVKNDNLIARKWNDLEADIQKSLRNGVIHYPGTALPGDNGNVVVTGHSSYYTWDAGRFKDVFALLHDVKNGDKIVVYFNQRKYTYEVFNIKIVLPKDVNVLGPTPNEQLTLITCTPVGTNLKRLIVQARLLSKT